MAVFVTEAYRDKVNDSDRLNNYCHFELSYAFRTKGRNKLIPVVMEESMRNNHTWGGNLNAFVGGIQYIDMSSDDKAVFEATCDRLAQVVKFGSTWFSDCCRSDENIDKIRDLLDGLSEDERKHVVNYRNEVSLLLSQTTYCKLP